MKVLLVDNFDSFTWNLVDYVSVALDDEDDVLVEKNTVSVEEVEDVDPDAVIISPGPGHPAKKRDIGNTVDIIESFSETPTLGVCLGHQALAEAYSGEVGRAPKPVHGKSSEIEHDSDSVYEGLPQGFPAGRYHSLIVKDVPDEFEVTAESRTNGIVMGMRHREKPLEGVQFHPESVLTAHGHGIIENFLEKAEEQKS